MEPEGQGAKRSSEAEGATGARCGQCGVPMVLSTFHDEEHRLDYEGFCCPGCGQSMVTLAQMQAYSSARDLKRSKPTKAKITKMGRGVGVVLPSWVKELGFEAGRDVEVSVIELRCIQLELLSPEPKR
ncbi:MAG: hypothetical protein HY815_04600 [Candidatus Riflebacteria bacterium]|nr:hypothetical protein [Candidatus Riflebacteria bacterium]